MFSSESGTGSTGGTYLMGVGEISSLRLWVEHQVSLILNVRSLSTLDVARLSQVVQV